MPPAYASAAAASSLTSRSVGGGRPPAPARPGPGFYETPPAGWKRRVHGSVKMRNLNGRPTEREMTLSNGVMIKNIMPAPASFINPPPRSVSPTLLRVAERQNSSRSGSRSRQRSPPAQGRSSPVRDCIISNQTDWANSPVGPGEYQQSDVAVSPARQGAYARGIVFSSVPRGLDPIPRPPPMVPGVDDVFPESVFGGPFPSSSSRSASPNAAAVNASPPRSAQRRPSMNLLQQRAILDRSSASPNNSSSNSPRSANRPGTSSRSTFGTSRRLCDLSCQCPFLPKIDQAPPPLSYRVPSGSARGGNFSPRGTKLGRAERVIALERKTAAPGPLSYDISHLTDMAPKPFF